MAYAFVMSGMLYSVGQYFLARRILDLFAQPGIRAVYIIQRLFLDGAILTAVYYLCEEALCYTALGLVSVAVSMSMIMLLKR